MEPLITTLWQRCYQWNESMADQLITAAKRTMRPLDRPLRFRKGRFEHQFPIYPFSRPIISWMPKGLRDKQAWVGGSGNQWIQLHQRQQKPPRHHYTVTGLALRTLSKTTGLGTRFWRTSNQHTKPTLDWLVKCLFWWSYCRALIGPTLARPHFPWDWADNWPCNSPAAPTFNWFEFRCSINNYYNVSTLASVISNSEPCSRCRTSAPNKHASRDGSGELEPNIYQTEISVVFLQTSFLQLTTTLHLSIVPPNNCPTDTIKNSCVQMWAPLR